MAALMELDETLCGMPVCQHPQCWVTSRRIEHGHARYRPLGAITRRSSLDHGGLPVLSVTTLPVTQSPSHHQDTQQLKMSSIVDFSKMSSSTVYNRYNSATCRMDKILFPGVNSYNEIPEAPRRSASHCSTRKPQQVVMVASFVQNLQSKPRTMVWVPNSQQQSQKQEMREKPLKVQITDLTFTDESARSRRENRNRDAAKNRRLNKPPTGGCPQNLVLSSSTSLMQSHVGKWTTASSGKDNVEGMMRSRRRANGYWPDLDVQTNPGLDGTLLENRRATLHNIREKRQPSAAISHSGPLYRLDEQTDALDNMEIDLTSIKNQGYLWKKYVGLAGPTNRLKLPDHKVGRGPRSGTLKASRQVGDFGLFLYDLDSALKFYKQRVSDTPAGSTVSDTERSRDSDIGGSPSLPGSSQTSFTEARHSNAPSDLDSGEISEQAFPHGEESAEPEEPTEGETTAQPPSDLPGEEESARQNAQPQSPPPNACGSEMADGHETPNQRAASPQPNPPPPSPTHSSVP